MKAHNISASRAGRGFTGKWTSKGGEQPIIKLITFIRNWIKENPNKRITNG